MPELAEVALFARDLSRAVQGQKLKAVAFPNRRDWGAVIAPPEMRGILNALVGQEVECTSRGKALFLSQEGTNAPLVEFRLGMTGQFHLLKLPRHWSRHYFLELHFERVSIYYADPRRFGRIKGPALLPGALGGFDRERGFWTEKSLALPPGFERKPRISWLLDAGEATGVGNYMANEALGRLRLSPFESCSSATEARCLLRKAAEIAFASYRQGGNSFGSGYFRLNGEEGRYSRYCRFYQNEKINRELFRGRPVFSRFSAASSNTS